jgi:hypothetical protein
LARNRNNVSEWTQWSDIFTRELLFQ